MNLKVSLLACLLSCSIAAIAQDKIYNKDGSVIDGKVKSVTTKFVTYKRASNPDGPDYSVLKKDVTRIVYQNGVTDAFDNDARGRRHGKMWQDDNGKLDKKGNNIISIIPGAYTADLNGIMSDPGLGISYERLLDERGHIGFTLPVVISFLSDRDFENNRYVYSYNPPYHVSADGYSSLSITPGIKFYPSNKSRPVRYALGASFFTMFGKQPLYVYDYNIPSTDDRRYAVYGLMISNSLNVAATKHFYLSLDFNGTLRLSDNRRAHKDDFDQVMLPMVQFLLKVGYRF